MEEKQLETELREEQNTALRQDEAQKSRTKMKAILLEIFSWIKVIVLAFVIALLLNHFIIVNANVPTGSMQNTIQPGDRLIGFRLSYVNHGPERGDIVMFRFPLDEEEIYIKRTIGLPGEHLEIRNGKVYIDGSDTPLKESYLKEEWVERNDGLTFDVPEDCYFMMGDNRNNSLDGRYWAEYAVDYDLAETEEEAVKERLCFVEREKILGKAIFRYYPMPKMMNGDPYQ